MIPLSNKVKQWENHWGSYTFNILTHTGHPRDDFTNKPYLVKVMTKEGGSKIKYLYFIPTKKYFFLNHNSVEWLTDNSKIKTNNKTKLPRLYLEFVLAFRKNVTKCTNLKEDGDL